MRASLLEQSPTDSGREVTSMRWSPLHECLLLCQMGNGSFAASGLTQLNNNFARVHCRIESVQDELILGHGLEPRTFVIAGMNVLEFDQS